MSCTTDGLGGPDDSDRSCVDLEALARLVGELSAPDAELESLDAEVSAALNAVLLDAGVGDAEAGAVGSVLGDGVLAEAFLDGFEATAARAVRDLSTARSQMTDHVAAMRALGEDFSRADGGLVAEMRGLVPEMRGR